MTQILENKTRMTIDIDTTLRNQIKARASLRGMKLREYVISSLKNQILEEDEDEMLGKLAMNAEKEGYIGVEKSAQFMKKWSEEGK
jgi:hypothetical protein